LDTIWKNTVETCLVAVGAKGQPAFDGFPERVQAGIKQAGADFPFLSVANGRIARYSMPN
jgi:hypothetical protein